MKRSGPESIGSLLERAVVRPARRSRSLLARAQRKWSRAAAGRLADHSRPVRLRRGLLTVEVDSSALLAELSGFRGAELAHQLAAGPEPLAVREIRFVPVGGGRA